MRASEERRLAAGVVAVPFVQPLLGFLVRHAAQDKHPVLDWRQRRQDRREFKLARGRRHPARHAHPVRHIDCPDPLHRARRAGARCGEGRHHAVEQRQRDGRAEAAQHRAS